MAVTVDCVARNQGWASLRLLRAECEIDLRRNRRLRVKGLPTTTNQTSSYSGLCSSPSPRQPIMCAEVRRWRSTANGDSEWQVGCDSSITTEAWPERGSVLRTLKFLMEAEAERQLKQRAEAPLKPGRAGLFSLVHSSATNQRYRSAGIGGFLTSGPPV
jgi:hypothetical protein